MGVLKPFVIGSVVGYTVENALYGPRQSAIVGPLPLMPAWGAGAAAIAAVAPRLKKRRMPWWGRVLVYSAGATAIEWSAGHAQHALGLPTTWGYGEKQTYVDVEHSLAWGVLGLIVDAFV